MSPPADPSAPSDARAFQRFQLQLPVTAMSEANTPFNRPESSEFLDASEEQILPNRNGETSTGDALAQPCRPHLADPWQDDPSETSVFDLDSIFDASALDGVAFEDDSPDMPQSLLGNDSEAAAETADLANHLPAEGVADALATPVLAEHGSAETLAATMTAEADVSLSAWSDEINPTAPPNLADLINLIQELNQCNGILMDRVSQLEEALESSQNALQAEVGRSHEPTILHSPNDWVALQEQITNLFNQLEFAHQTNQRQQILIETLTEQLESSQERVAELEREAALLQQRYSEQAQLFAKSETACRDLQARLQRQQRYTLQFKAALEKCLEVPTPNYEMGVDSPAAPLTVDPFLPKAQQIQPWSADAQLLATKAAWMKLQALSLEAVPETNFSTASVDTDETTAVAAKSATSPTPHNATPRTTSHLKLPSFGLPLLQVSGLEEATDQLAAEIPPAQTSEIGSQPEIPSVTDPALKQHIDAAVKPLAEMLAEAILADRLTDGATEPAVAPATETPSPFAQSFSDAESAEEAIDEPMTAEQLLASTMADAEDALWQDLARLIDVSPEDVVRASRTGDFAAFESMPSEGPVTSVPEIQIEPRIEPEKPVPSWSGVRPFQVDRSAPNMASLQPTAEATHPPAEQGDTSTISLIRKVAKAAQQTPSMEMGQPTSAQESQGLIPALAHQASWPSPIVYPLRPTKKRQSLAMVDLPTFPRGQA